MGIFTDSYPEVLAARACRDREEQKDQCIKGLRAEVARRGIDAGAACCRCPKTTDDEPSEWTFAEDIGWLCRECAAHYEEDR